MRLRLIQSIRNIRVKRILLACAIVFCVCMGLALALFACFPFIVSSLPVQTYIRKSLSVSLKRPVAWSRLAMSWTDGLAVSGLRLGDGPAPLLNTSLGEIIVTPGFGRKENGRLTLSLAAKVRDVRAELAPGPPRPKPAKDPLTALAEAVQKVQGLDFPLPVDVRVTAEVAPLRVVYRGSVAGRDLRLDDFAFRLDLPSLSEKPIVTEMAGRMALADRQLGQVRLKAKVSKLVSAERIRPASALIEADAALPGASVTARGGLSEADGFVVRGRFELPELFAMLRPILPPTLPTPDGKIDLDLRAKIDSAHNLQAFLDVTGRKIAAAGGRLKSARVGPVDLHLRQRISSDYRRQRVEFPGGSLAVAGLVEAAWSAVVDRPGTPGRALEARFGPLRLDLARALELAGPFLQSKMPVKELTGEVALRSLVARLQGPGNDGEAVIEGFGMKLPTLHLALSKGICEGEGIDLILDRATFPLAAFQPTRLDAAISWGVRRLSLSGRQPVSMQGGRGNVQVAVTDLDLKSKSPRRFTAVVDMKQALDLDNVSAGTRLALKNVHHQLRLLLHADAAGEIDVTLPEMDIAVAEVSGVASGRPVSPFPLSASLTADGLRMPAGGGRPTLRRAQCEATAGAFLKLSATAGLSAAKPEVTTSGSARLDMDRIVPLAAPFLPKGVAIGGVAAAGWDIALPLPKSAPPAEKNRLRVARAGLAMLQRGDITLALSDGKFRIPSAKGAILVNDLRTTAPLRLIVARGGEAVRVKGGMSFAGLRGLPGAAGQLPAQSGSFSIDGDLTEWKSLRFYEDLRMDPLGLSHMAEMTVDRIEPLLEERGPLSAAMALKRLDATLFAHVDAAFSRESGPLPGGLDVSGKASAGARVNLTAGRDLRVRAYVESNDLGVRQRKGTTVEGIRSELVVDRTYTLATTRGDSWVPLSTALVRPAAEGAVPSGATDIATRIREDLRGEARGTRKLGIRHVAAKVSGVPVKLTAVEGDLLIDPEEVGLGFFQAEVLGGTVRARGVIDLRPDVPTLAAACSFSHLDMALLLPEKSPSGGLKELGDTEITGDAVLEAPLLTGQRELLEGMRVKMNIHKIGSHTLERALFSLDPYERNEQLVAQRKLLRRGGLKWLRAGTVDGALSVDGEAVVGGVPIAIPRVERVRLSELPIHKQTEKAVTTIAALRKLLDMARADMMIIGPDGRISLRRSTHAQ